MTDLRQAAQQALEALEELDGLDTETECVTIDVGDVITAIRAALEQQQAEPVGEVTAAVDGAFKCEFSKHLPVGTKLYTAPPPRKPLTDEMRKQMKEASDNMEMRGAFANGWLSAEAAHGIKEGT